MPGNDKSAAHKAKAFQAKIDEYRQKISVPTPLPRHIDHYINMPRSELGNLSEDDLKEIAFEIETYALYIQDKVNRHKMMVEHCRHNIFKTIGSDIRGYKDIYGQDAQWYAAIMDNEHAREWKEIEVNNQAIVTDLAYLATGLDRIARTVAELQQSKRRTYGKV